MNTAAEKLRRRSIRLREYDYRQPGAYFITVVAHGRAVLFGEIAGGETRLNEYGRIVEDEWQKSSIIRREIELDAFVVMPNHIHGIVNIIDADVGANRPVAPTQRTACAFIGRLYRRFQIRCDQTY